MKLCELTSASVFGHVGISAWSCYIFYQILFKYATRGHAYKLYKPSCVNSTRNRYFAERIVNVWNFLPSSVNFSTLNDFKRSIVPIDFSLFSKSVTD